MSSGLRRAINRASIESVTMPWPDLASLVQPHRGDLVLVLAAPGVGKSFFSLSWALEVEKPALIVSLDTDLRTQAVRIVAKFMGQPIQDVDALPNEELVNLSDECTPPHLRFFDLTPCDVAILDEVLLAEEAYWGEEVCLTIVDNVSNIVKGPDYTDYSRAFSELQQVARRRNTCLVVTHHVTRGFGAKGDKPLRLSDGKFTGEQDAQVVLGLWRGLGILRVGVLKNRYGQADPNGRISVALPADLSRAQIGERS